MERQAAGKPNDSRKGAKSPNAQTGKSIPDLFSGPDTDSRASPVLHTFSVISYDGLDMTNSVKALLTIFVAATTAIPLAARENVEIKSGTNGTTYCVPFDDPRCRSHSATEMQRLNERREYERQIDEMRRKERIREIERGRPNHDGYRDESWRR